MAEEKKDLAQREPPVAPDAEAQRLAAEKGGGRGGHESGGFHRLDRGLPDRRGHR